ncbi:MAG: acyl-CoA thioesterase II [Salinisphaeraceae bacterium]
MSDTPSRVLQDLVDLLDLENIEVNLFRGESRDLGGKSVFGGQVLGQALVAATRTVDEGVAHSLHAYFLRPGAMDAPIVYEVDRVRDGRSFAARRVQAIQHGRPICSVIASFQQPEEGASHQAAMPEVPSPESLAPQSELRRKWMDDAGPLPERLQWALTRPLALEFRPVNPWNGLNPDAREPQQQIWFKAAGPLPAEPVLHRCMLAYASDYNLLTTALLPHRMSFLQPDMVVASIDHALWFHRTPRVDDWLLYDMDSPAASGARGLTFGRIFSRDGDLVASVAQENLMRRIDGKRE